MPGYEMSLIVRSMARPKIVEAVKRAAGHVYESGGFIRKLECLGEERELPQKQNIHGEWHDKGAFFILTCDVPTAVIPPIVAELGRDIDVLKKNFVAVAPGHADPPDGCTLAEELLPPSQRPSIHEMMEMGKRPKKYERKFEPRTGLDYYPFKR